MGGSDDWWQILSKKGLVGEREKHQYRAQKIGMAFADLDRIVLDPKATSAISSSLARELRVLPVKRDGDTLWLAMDEPQALEAAQKVREATGCRVIPVMCVSEALDAALANLS